MTLVYFDSSALVKLVLDEAGSDLAAELWNACDAALTSRLAYPEVCAALASATRNHDLTQTEAAAAADDWEQFWASTRAVELSADVGKVAGEMAVRYRLGSSDAVHLASALALDSDDVTIAVWDKRLHGGAGAVGFALAPATLD